MLGSTAIVISLENRLKLLKTEDSRYFSGDTLKCCRSLPEMTRRRSDQPGWSCFGYSSRDSYWQDVSTRWWEAFGIFEQDHQVLEVYAGSNTEAFKARQNYFTAEMLFWYIVRAQRRWKLGYIMFLTDATETCQPLVWSSHKSRWVTSSVLVYETMALADGFDMAYILKHELKAILGQESPIAVYTDSLSLFEVIMEATTMVKRRLLI